MKRMIGGITDNGRAVCAHIRPDAATVAFILAAIGLLVSCGEEGPVEPAAPPPVAAVSVSPERDSLDALDETVQFSATPRDAEANPLTGKSISWDSSDPTIVEISTSGLATAVANGAVTISASADGVTGTTTLTVSQVGTAVRVAAQPTRAAVGVPFATQPVVEILDKNGHVVENDDESVVTVSIASGGGVLLGATSVTVRLAWPSSRT